MESCCWHVSISDCLTPELFGYMRTHSGFHALTTNELHTAHHVLLHLDELRQLLGEIWTERTSRASAKGVALRVVSDE